MKAPLSHGGFLRGRRRTGSRTTDAYIPVVLLDVGQGRTAYVSTSERAYRPSDSGVTWQAVSGLAGRVHAFAIGANGGVYAALTGEVARSTDEGQSWTRYGTGLRPGDRVLHLAVDPGDLARLYAAAWDGIYVSSDGGQNWARRDVGPGYPDVNVLAWDAAGNLLAGTRSGLFRKGADGVAWEPVPSLQGRAVSAVERSADGQIFYAGCSAGLFRSTDGGLTWLEVPSELSGAAIADLIVDLADPDHLYAWVAFGRVHESRDAGRSWVARWKGLGDVRPVTAIHQTHGGQIYAGAEDGLFRWEPARQAWQPLSLPLVGPTVFVVATDARIPQAVYAGATDGLWRSLDSGKTWSRWGRGLEGITVTALAISLADERIALAGTRHMGLYATADGGATWRPAWEGRLASASVRDILFSADGKSVYVASNQGIWSGESDGAP